MNKLTEKDIEDAIEFDQQLHYTFDVADVASSTIATFPSFPGPGFTQFFNTEGKLIVSINMETGHVEVFGDVNEAAIQFWKAVELMFPYRNNNKE